MMNQANGISRMKTPTIMLVFNRLLADISELSGLSLNEGSAGVSLSWCINDAPKLEKQILGYLEGRPFEGVVPEWLSPLVNRFFLDENPVDLRYLRQLLLFCYKAEHKYTNETENKTVADWCATNDTVRAWDEHFNAQSHPLARVAKKHCSSVVCPVNWSDITPYHGPGAVFDGNLNKGCWSKWFTTIDYLYPYFDYFSVSRHLMSELGIMEVDDTIVARLIAVPKDSRGPRLICVHPTESIWIQEGLRDRLEKAITKLRRHCKNEVWPRGHIHFNDQTVNADIALKASIDQSYATIDLKEASDRISDRLVQYLFGRAYKWFGCCRASKVLIPKSLKSTDGKDSLVDVYSYAPMGNATTFPVESLVFWSICVAAMEVAGANSPGDVYVFGDDIAIPSRYYSTCIDALESFGLVVNREKSFNQGFFRESCGCDAFKGTIVTPIRWKATYYAESLEDLQSLSDIAQRLRMSNYEYAANECYRILRAKMKCREFKLYKTNNPDHGGIAEYVSDRKIALTSGFKHTRDQRLMSRVHRLSTGSYEHVHGWNHVLSSLSSLKRTGRSNSPTCAPSRRTRLTRGWAEVIEYFR